MKKILFCLAAIALALSCAPANTVLAAGGDLVLSPTNVSFSASNFIEGKTVRIYATAVNPSDQDLRGVIKFFDNKIQIKGDQPISVLAGKDDSVFVDFAPSAGEHKIEILIVPFDNDGDNPSNNSIIKTITVLMDTDRDGVPNIHDPDDDNDGVKDDEDAFPYDKTEWVDSDGDRIGNNKDPDDDNDGVPDSEDALPLNPLETIDTDGDGIGNNEDKDDDGDTLPDTEEDKTGTDPLKADTDGDSVNDNEDAFPTDPAKAYDYDKDGLEDSIDPDADNDGILKINDTNDINLGPVIKITSNKKSPRKIVFPNENVQFETTDSIDPDGKITSTKWRLMDKTIDGEKIAAAFQKMGANQVEVTLTDDKNETRQASFKVYVIPPWLPWLATFALFIIFILAIFFVFSYSKRRRSKFTQMCDTLDFVLKWIDKRNL